MKLSLILPTNLVLQSSPYIENQIHTQTIKGVKEYKDA